MAIIFNGFYLQQLYSKYVMRGKDTLTWAKRVQEQKATQANSGNDDESNEKGLDQSILIEMDSIVVEKPKMG